MNRYELLQALEMMLPSREDWFISDEDAEYVVVCFSIDEENTEDETKQQV